MGYSTSEVVVRKQLPNLKRIIERQPLVIWKVPNGEESKFAYKIREALFAGSCHPNKFPGLRTAHQDYKVSVLGPGKVAAKLSGAVGKVRVADESERGEAVEVPIEVQPDTRAAQESDEGESDREESVVDDGVGGSSEDVVVEVPAIAPIPGQQTVYSILGHWSANPGVKLLHFPHANLSTQHLTMLYAWAVKQEPRLMLMCNPPNPELTVAVENEDVEFSWTPDEV